MAFGTDLDDHTVGWQQPAEEIDLGFAPFPKHVHEMTDEVTVQEQEFFPPAVFRIGFHEKISCQTMRGLSGAAANPTE